VHCELIEELIFDNPMEFNWMNRFCYKTIRMGYYVMLEKGGKKKDFGTTVVHRNFENGKQTIPILFLEENTYTGKAVFTPLDANSPEGVG